MRAVPELVLILLLYYSGTDAINQLLALTGFPPVDISGLVAGIFVIGVVQGAYSTEVLRGAIKAGSDRPDRGGARLWNGSAHDP